LYNADNPLLAEMVAERQAQRLVCYGATANKATILPTDAAYPFLRLSVKGYPEINTQLVGTYNADNVLAALAVAQQFGVDAEEAAAAINRYRSYNNRSQLLQKGTCTFIMDAYNANPSSMAAAIENFSGLQAPHKWAVLGDMLELGAETAAEHRNIIKLLKEKQLHNVFLVGACFMEANTNNDFQTFLSVDDLTVHLKQQPFPPQTTILLKGSRGIRVEEIMNYEL
jgi:UDP-N-acetylmuramoyl-tripeptide--D-alanyl-D-alanine ligase